MIKILIFFLSFFSDNEVNVDIDDVVGGLRAGGKFRVLVCVDTGSEDPPWHEPVFSIIILLISI